MKIYCLKCFKKFVPTASNTKILGPYVEVNCPYCLDVYEGKFLNFVGRQVGNPRQQSARDAARMIELAEFIELNSSEYYKKRGQRHGKKKVRNVRN